jgi:hypothetical protein
MTVPQLVEWFKVSLGEPLIENKITNTVVLGSQQGGHYLTIQIAKNGSGSRALIGSSRLDALQEIIAPTVGKQVWVSSFFPDSKVVSHLVSTDYGRSSIHIILTNENSQKHNEERVKEAMKSRGLSIQHESDAQAIDGHTAVQIKTMFFKGGNREGMARITRPKSKKTVVVLNLISQ